MSLAKQIGSVSKTALTNAGHMNMNNEIYARILDTTVAALHLEALAPGYKECIDREAECVNRVTKSASTAQLEAKDKERDKTLQFIYSMNGSYKVCPDETLRPPALLVDSVLRAYDKIYAKAYAEETALIDGLRRAGGTLALPEFYDEVLNQTGYVRALEEKKDMESRGRIENVQELKSNILGFLEQDPEDATLSGFLNEIALYTDLDSVEADDNCVTMMTIHSAKGLEFPVVYVVGMEEGIFPGTASMYDEEELEEERRLCYVAMTRAREKLVMTNARQRMLYGRTSANKSSRFLDEIPAEDMRWESKPEPKFGTYDEDSFGGSRWGDDFGGGSFGGSSYSGSSGRSGGYVSGGVHTYKSTKPTAQTLRTSSRGSTPAAPSVGLIQLSQGDQVEHTAFGKGTVVSVKPMGGDALAEVAFEGGTKKLMLKAAGKHLKKL